MDFTIYSIGDSDFLETVLVALSMITNTGDFSRMVAIGLVIGVLGILVSAIINGGRQIDFQHVLVGYLIFATMFLPRADVNIEDNYSGAVVVVDDVPIGPVAVGAIISTIGIKLTELFETAYNPLYPRATTTQFAESLVILNKLRNDSVSSPVWLAMNSTAGGGGVNLHQSWANYIRDCSLKKVDLGMISMSDLTNQTFSQALYLDSVLLGTSIFVESGNYSAQNITCRDAWPILMAHTQITGAVVDAITPMIGLDTKTMAPGDTAITKTQSALDAMAGVGVNASEYMVAALLQPLLYTSAANKYSTLQDTASALMVNQAIQQRNTSWAAGQTLFMSTVRPMMAFFESFIYAITPFMAFVLVLGSGGLKLAPKYIFTILWIQCWMPILSIVNLYIYVTAERKFQVLSSLPTHNWTSFYAIETAADTAQNFLATGGWLASATPLLSMFLLFGGSVAMSSLAGKLFSSDDYVDEKYNTPDLKSNPPVLTQNSVSSYDASGLSTPGAKFPDLALGSTLSASYRSEDSQSFTNGQSIASSAASSILSSNSHTRTAEMAKQYSQALKSTNSEAYSRISNAAQEIAASNGLGSTHAEVMEGMMAAELTGAVQGSSNLTKLEDKLGKYVDQAKVSLGISGRGSMKVGNNDSVKQSVDQVFSDKDGFVSSMKNDASFVSDMGTNLTKAARESDANVWSNTDTQQQMRNNMNTLSRVNSYQQMADYASRFGLNNSKDLRQVGDDIYRRGPEFYKPLLEHAHNNFDPNYQQNFGEMQKMYSRLTHNAGGGTVASIMAALQSNLSPTNYPNDDSRLAGAQLAFNTIAKSQGQEGLAFPDSAGSNVNIGDRSLNAVAPVALPGGGSVPAAPGFENERFRITDGDLRDHERQTAINRGSVDSASNARENPIRQNHATQGMKDFNSSVVEGRDSTGSIPAYVAGSADHLKAAVSQYVSPSSTEVLSKGFEAANSRFSAFKNEISQMSPEEVAANRESYNAEIAGGMAGAVASAGQWAVGAHQSFFEGGKPDGMSNAEYGDRLMDSMYKSAVYGAGVSSAPYIQAETALYNQKVSEGERMGLSSSDGTAQLYANSFSGAFRSMAMDAQQKYNPEASAPTAINTSIADPVTNYNQFKRSLAPEADSNGYYFDQSGQTQQAWHYEQTESGQVVVLNDETRETFANNAADKIYQASWLGNSAQAHLAPVNRVLDINNPDRR